MSATEPSSVPAATTGIAASGIAAEMDRLSLEQSLLDTELANARVIDLTRRLQEAHAEVEQLRLQLDGLERGELEKVKAERDELAAYKSRLQRSLPYKLARRGLALPGASRLVGMLRG
jgi:hypothetical protein